MRKAHEIYTELQKIADELIKLSESGTVTMSKESLNENYSNTVDAFRVAYDSVVKACEATQWMETVDANIH